MFKVKIIEWNRFNGYTIDRSRWTFINGKRVKNAKLLKKGTNILALNNAEKFRFNNKTYYQIGKNQYVKVANTL